MSLILSYLAIIVVGEGIAVGIGELVEQFSSSASLVVFIALFFTVLTAGWPLAIRLTDR